MTNAQATSYAPTTLSNERGENADVELPEAIEEIEEERTDEKKIQSPEYHVVVKDMLSGLETLTFPTKKDLYAGLKTIDPDRIYNVFRGRKMSLGVRHLYTVE